MLFATVALSTLLGPAIGSLAGPGNQLERTESKLDQIRAELDRDRAQAGNLKAEIKALEASITKLQIQLSKLDAEIAKVQARVHDAEARIADTRARMDEIEARAIDQAVALYTSGGSDVLGTLLSSKSLAELDARAQVLGIAARENTDALIEFGRLKVQIEVQARDLFTKRRELARTQAERSELLAAQRASKSKLDDLYQRVTDEIAHLEHREGDLEAEAESLRDEILAAQAQQAVENLGRSAQGFIWPLNGPITSGYGPRWGTMHTGIDIDGYTGQPIVASKAGQVILSSYYSGYGNTVIIDHGGGIASLYGHMSSFNVSAGNPVAQGEVVGAVGCTGSCTGDHLHFEVRVNGNPVNPLDYLP